jgi:hypothetical protein
MTTDAPSTNPYYEQAVGKEAAIFLSNLLHFNLDSRVHMATGILNGIYKQTQQRRGDLASLDDTSRHQLLDLITLDILSKVFMALEDLGKVLLSSGKPLKDLRISFLM